MHITDKEVQKRIKQLGYQGCKNCQHQIAPLRMCRWAEQGGDGQIRFICPMWDKGESEQVGNPDRLEGEVGESE